MFVVRIGWTSNRREVNKMGFRYCNCIVVFDKNKEKLLFCKRAKNPYKGLINFVGGKVEPEETSENAAYRELFEETGIFANKLNSQETCAMSKLCESKAYNYLIILKNLTVYLTRLSSF